FQLFKFGIQRTKALLHAQPILFPRVGQGFTNVEELLLQWRQVQSVDLITFKKLCEEIMHGTGASVAPATDPVALVVMQVFLFYNVSGKGCVTVSAPHKVLQRY